MSGDSLKYFGKLKKGARLFDLPLYQLTNGALDKALSTKYQEKWQSISTAVLIDESSKFSRGLLDMGLIKGDKIAVLAHVNSHHWHIIDVGAMQIGVQLVPMYPNTTDANCEYIINHSEVKYCFVSNQELFDKIENIKPNVAKLSKIYMYGQCEGHSSSWNEILEKGRTTEKQQQLELIRDSITDQDIATLIYTSGTTAEPKGVVLTHRNILSNVLACSSRLTLKSRNGIAMSFLPISHVYERMMVYLYMYSGLSIYFAESMDKIGANIKEIKPHIMTTVPRVLEKVYGKILDKGNELSGLKKKLFFWAIRLGQRYQHSNKWYNVGYQLQLILAKKLVFSKWKDALGGRIEVIVSGSAPLQNRLANIFSVIAILLEGYGMTETSPVMAVNDCKTRNRKIGTVGKPINGVEIKILADGEIICKGSNVMKGYYNNLELTQEVIKDGYLYTGDIGHIDEDGFLVITDRKKEIFKTSGGKYVAPQLIENQMKQSLLIENIIVVGEGQKMPSAIICPDFEKLERWAEEQKITFVDHQDLINNNVVIDKYQQEIDGHNEHFSQWEKIKKIRLVTDEWSVENSFLTPTLKIKRRVIVAHYQSLISEIYES